MEQDNPSGGGFSSRLDELIKEATATSSADAPVSGGASPPPTSGMPDLSGLLGGLAANPELMAKLPQMISTLGPMLSGMSGGAGRGSGGFHEASPPPSSPHPSHPPHGDRHTALLCAIKPYLCAERQAAADRLIQLCKMEGLLQNVAPPRSEKGGEGHV